MVRKGWILTLLAGAAVVTAGAILASTHKKKRRKQPAPEFCGYCGDDDVMREECRDTGDTTILHNRRGV